MAYYGLLLTWILDYIRPGATSPVVGALKLYTVVPLLTFLIAVTTSSRTSHGEIWSSSNLRWLLFFVIWILLSTAVAVRTDLAFTRLNQAFGYVLMFYIIARAADDLGKIKGLMRALIAIHIVLIALNPELVTEPEQRHYLGEVTFLGDGNDFALSVCFVFPMGLFLYRTTQSKIWRWIYGISLLTLVLAVIGTQSRGASLALGATLLFLWWESRNKAVGTVAIVMLLVAGLFFAGPSYFTRMSTLGNVHADGSAQGRLDAWTQATYLGTRKNPMLGVGAGNFPLWNGNLTAHSIYFLALGELGIPGAVFTVGFMVGNWRRNARSAKALKEEGDVRAAEFRMLFQFLAASTIGLAVAGAFLSALYYPHIFILGGLSLAAHAVFSRESREKGVDTKAPVEKKATGSWRQRRSQRRSQGASRA